MKNIKLNLKNRSYTIVIGSNIIIGLAQYIRKLNLGDDAYIITNAFLKNKYGRLLERSFKQAGLKLKFKLVADSEKSKSLDTAFKLVKDIAAYSQAKRFFVLAFGGGVIGDLVGFVASIYKRGIAYIQVPTTLLAQVDSSIGGKTGVDLKQGKNLVGTFYQPRLVFSDISLLGSLDVRQLSTALAEIIKYAVIQDEDLLRFLEGNFRKIFALQKNSLEFVVAACSQIKARIIQQDEREEKGIRTILNFGHTLGHAIERAAGYKAYNHGEALALGMLLACDISQKLGLLNNPVAKRIERLIAKAGLPTRISKVAIADIISAHYYDKKFSGAKNKFVLIQNIAKTKIVENIPLKVIKEALEKRS